MTKKQKQTLLRIAVSGVLFILLMVRDRLDIPAGLPDAARLILYLVPYAVIGWDVVWAAIRNAVRGNLFEEHFLMTVATFAAFALGAFGDGEYPEAVAVMLFYQIGELFQSVAVGKSRKNVAEMMELAPQYAWLETESGEIKADPEDVRPGQTITVKPGERIPLDGEVIRGESYVDTSSLTGESVPVKASPGDRVVSGCVNGNGTLTVKVTAPFKDSTVSRILELVENASSRKARLENFITRFSRYYTPAVTLCALLLALLTPLTTDLSFSEGIRRACSFLIVSCPCALVISVPLGFFGGIGAASRKGILVKGSNYLEAAANAGIMVFDKTGTLTKGEFAVREILPAPGTDKSELLELCALAEAQSDHPIALSVKRAYGAKPDLSRISSSEAIPGKGVRCVTDRGTVLAGNAALMADNGIEVNTDHPSGTAVYAALDGRYMGVIVISDAVKEDAADAVAQLKRLGIKRTVMLTGDNEAAAREVSQALGIDEVYSGLLPADKAAKAQELMDGADGSVCFAGDGINDAPVLMLSDVGFAMGSLGSDAAIEAADVVVMDDSPQKIPETLRIAKKTVGVVRANVIFALAVKLAILVLSALGVSGMWTAVFGDVGVAILCILNSMRLLRL